MNRIWLLLLFVLSLSALGVDDSWLRGLIEDDRDASEVIADDLYGEWLNRLEAIEEPRLALEISDDLSIAGNELESQPVVVLSSKPFVCDVCSKGFPARGHLAIHKRSHTGERPYQCDECKRRFNRPSSLKVHKRVHTGERPYQCDECDKRFNRPSSLKRHKQTHSRKRAFQSDKLLLDLMEGKDLVQSKKKRRSGDDGDD